MAKTSLRLLSSITCAAALLLTETAQSATQIPDEFWVSTTTNTANIGTLAEPLNASTQPLFDAVMQKMPPNCIIHLLSGTYQTRGTWQARSGGWHQLKGGQRLVGSGMDHTIIHLSPPGPGSFWFGTPGMATTNIEVSDLTIDGAGTTNCDGLWLSGDHMIVRRVKVVNLTSVKIEIFPICIQGGLGASGGTVTNSEGNLVEDCEVNLPNITWVSGICMGGNPKSMASGAVRNNRVLLGAYKPKVPVVALNLGYAHDVLVEGNYVLGGNTALYSENGFRNLMVHHNTFKNVEYGAYFVYVGSTNVTFSFNTIELATTPQDTHGFVFQAPQAFKNILMFGNTIQFSTRPAPRTSYALYTTTGSGISFLNNLVDNRLVVETSGSAGVNIGNNSDLAGAPLSLKPTAK